MNKLFVIGGQRRTNARTTRPFTFESAKILEVDLELRRAQVCFDYQSPREVCASEDPNFLFKAGTIVGDKLYVCTETEILTLQLPTFERIGYVSLPCFNDLHHVTPTSQGNLIVANTGLDMVIEVTPQGRIRRQWDVLGRPLWSRFSRQVDYRKIASTKPHDSHPNFVILLGDDVWVTRCNQLDATCLTRPGHSISLCHDKGHRSVLLGAHDGVAHDERLYFTTVNGHVVVADARQHNVLQDYDLNEGSLQPLGWCRGICPLDENTAFVGFTRLRQTSQTTKLGWLRGGINYLRKKYQHPTRIALYDLPNRKVLREINLEEFGINAVFSIHHFAPTRESSQEMTKEPLEVGVI